MRRLCPQFTGIENWLKRRMAFSCAHQLALSAALFALAFCVLILTYYLTFAVIWFGFNYGVSSFFGLFFDKSVHLSNKTINHICFGVLALLFLEYFRVNPQYWKSYTIKARISPSLVFATGLVGSLLVLLINFESSSKMIADVLLTGPNLVIKGFLTLGKAFKFVSFDVRECSTALSMLLESKVRVPLVAFVRTINPTDLIKLISSLQAIEGVILLTNEPIGFVIDDDLRRKLGAVFNEDNVNDSNQHNGQPVEESDESHGVLGLVPPCSIEEIKAAYRQRMKECHPDRFENDEPALREWAEEQTKTVNAAYEQLLRKANGNQ